MATKLKKRSYLIHIKRYEWDSPDGYLDDAKAVITSEKIYSANKLSDAEHQYNKFVEKYNDPGTIYKGRYYQNIEILLVNAEGKVIHKEDFYDECR